VEQRFQDKRQQRYRENQDQQTHRINPKPTEEYSIPYRKPNPESALWRRITYNAACRSYNI
jgi:hypothetical protein